MYPIQMQQGKRGIGMGYEDFVQAFESVCREHLRLGRARVFAFVFYDMTHGVVCKALHQAHGFRLLHERTGHDVTLFYLHESAADAHLQTFNVEFMKALGVEEQAKAPCIVFFRVANDCIEDVALYPIDELSTDPVLTAAEIEGYVVEAINALNAEGDVSALTSIGKAVVNAGVVVKLVELLERLGRVA